MTSQNVALPSDFSSKKFMDFYFSLPEKPNTTIQFFSRGDFYTVHGNDAVFMAKEVFKTTNVLKTMTHGALSLQYLNLSKVNFETHVRQLLLYKQYCVEVLICKDKSSDWVLEYKGSPGNLQQFEDILFHSDVTVGSSVVALHISSKKRVLGLAYVSMADLEMSVVEFIDDEYFSTFESVIVQLGPKECLLVDSEANGELKNAKQAMERLGILVTVCNKSDFTTTDLEMDLNKLLEFKQGQKEDSATLPELKLNTACRSLGALVKYLKLVCDLSFIKKFHLKLLDIHCFVRLDAAAVFSLNLLPQGTSSNSFCLLNLLNKCRTPQGHRLLEQWIKKPLRDINKINERLDVVDVLVKTPEIRSSLYEDNLRRFPDLQNLAKRLLRRKANLQDCFRIYQAILILPHLLKLIEDLDDVSCTAMFVDPLKELINDVEKFKGLVEATIDMEHAEKAEFFVMPRADDELAELMEAIEVKEKQMQKELYTVAGELSLEPHKGIKLESNAQAGYYFRVTLKEEKALRNSKYEVFETNKAGVRFRNTNLKSLNEDYLELRSSYEVKQKETVAFVIDIAAGYSDVLYKINSVLATLDVLTSFAEVSVSAPKPYVRPILLEPGSGKLCLKQVRHPCVERRDGVSYVPNDVEFEKGERTFYILTGPNMGGKSTYIRSIGVCVFMAQIGCFVPCDEAVISAVDTIFARVGADDCQMKNMSTFMKEMVETASILRSATQNSLIMIDELGRGTSTYEGCGIAWAIAEHIAVKLKAFTLFATHFHEVTKLSSTVSTIHNVHVSAMTVQGTLTLLYRVEPGVCDQSFAIHVAEMANFPADVIEDAKCRLKILESEEQDLDSVINKFFQMVRKIHGQGLSLEDQYEAINELKVEIMSNYDLPFLNM